MKTVPLPKVYGHAIFCDDIRHEVDGKTSYIGAYNGRMIVHSDFPVVLAKFAILVTYYEKQDEVDGDLSVRIYFPGDSDDQPSAKLDAELSTLRPNLPKTQTDPVFLTDEVVRRIDIPFQFSPLVIKDKGLIKVRAFIGDDIIKLGALRVEQQIIEIPEIQKHVGFPPPKES